MLTRANGRAAASSEESAFTVIHRSIWRACGAPFATADSLPLPDPSARMAGMEEDAFWALLEEFRPAGPDPDADRLATALTARLTAGPVSLVTGFAEHLAWALY
ncbi:hypothetical protein GCM10010121_078510 [Streptomyces brasiliensis]|uniref:Uncharacterized protein n=2 Tax=Streptomyces brasiliensis TaxID=1954 RepID=A0A917LAM7_9ACTN|nr:hypothetical protein GCM10010121_078510 [Streptomyces brasiliensis]